MTSEPTYHVVVLELTNVVSRIRTDRPNIYVGVTTRTPQELADGLNDGKYKPAWKRNNVVGLLDEHAPTGTFTYIEAKQLRDDLKRQLRTKGYTVNEHDLPHLRHQSRQPEPQRPRQGLRLRRANLKNPRTTITRTPQRNTKP